jgi:hypothetical protein
MAPDVVSQTPGAPSEKHQSPQYGGALAGIAKRHEEIRAESHLTLFIPSYEGHMKVRYRLLPEVDMDKLGRRIEEAQRGEGVAAALDVEADILVQMCDRIFVRDPEADEYQVLEDEKGPVRFESHLAAILSQAGVQFSDEQRAREIVQDLFSPRQDPSNPSSPRSHPQAMELHTNAILAWHRGQKESIDRRLLGE